VSKNLVFVRAELRREVSCFVPPEEQGELYLSCKTFGVISVVRARLGSRTDNVTSLLAACEVTAIFSYIIVVVIIIIIIKVALLQLHNLTVLHLDIFNNN